MTESKKVINILQESQREVMKIVVVGHVDHGKSTVIGRLLHDTNSLPLGTVEKVRNIARDTGKPFEYAYLLDAFEEEQKQGITIDTTQIQFHTSTRDYVIIDAPGHKEFLKNMISGAANAEAAFLIVDVKEGIQEQSKRHAYMLSLLGIRKVYVIVNKMDLVNYDSKAFEDIKETLGEFLSSLNLKPLGYIPLSAYYGDNVLEPSKQLAWYKGGTVIQAMDLLEKEKGLEEQSLRFPIQDVYKFDHRRIIAGRIERGRIRVGDKIKIYPEGKETTVKSIESWGKENQKLEAHAGESVGITVEHEFFNKRGEVVTGLKDLPYRSDYITANLFWMGEKPLKIGNSYKFKLSTVEVEGVIQEVRRVVDASNLEIQEVEQEVKRNGVAEVVIHLKKEIAFDRFDQNPATGRFVLVDEYDVMGGGIITDTQEVEQVAVFQTEELEGRGEIFEEFYYHTGSQRIEKVKGEVKQYTVGDQIPICGESYQYPEDFDVLILRDHLVIQVRKERVQDIKPLRMYAYEGYPVVNGRGFGIKGNSATEIQEFLKEWEEKKEEVEFWKKWLRFDRYRKIAFLK